MTRTRKTRRDRRAMGWLQAALMVVLIGAGVLLAGIHPAPIPTAPHRHGQQPATARDALLHDLEQAQARDQAQEAGR